MYGMRKEQARTHAAQLLKKLDLWNARDRKVYTFSTEMCRRLSLARALVHHPQIVFSDGLPGGEQAVSDAMVLRTLSDYAKETGATVLLCTDHLESTEEICTSFAVLEHGFLRRAATFRAYGRFRIDAYGGDSRERHAEDAGGLHTA